MQVISGKYRARKLESIQEISTRPTLAKVKESMFAMIDDKIDDAIADCEAHKEQISCVVALPGISAHFLPLGNTYRHDFQSNVIVSDIVEFLI